jgi:regulator of protease activity HflC (stomatin/prohibitin superfamily)
VAGRSVIGPGLHFKLPWPIDQVYRYRTEQIQRFIVGAEPETVKTIQWTVPHAQEDNFLVANRSSDAAAGATNAAASTNLAGGHPTPPVSLLSISIPVQYQITNLADWAYVNQDPAALLQRLSRRAVVRFLAGAELTNLMSDGRRQAADALRQAIQTESNERQLGVNITFVGLEDIHPPVKVAADYEKVVSERERAEVTILTAQAQAILTNALARGVFYQRLAEAQADKANAITNAAARADLFQQQALAYAAAPGLDGVYEHRAYLDELAKITQGAQKTIINASGNTNRIYEFNEEEKVRDFGNTLSMPSKPAPKDNK